MRRIRLLALGIVSFIAVLMGALLAPGTFVNRALSAALCTVFSFNSTVCTVNLAQSGDRVVAATPPAVERNIADWLVQRDPGEFDDAPSVPQGGSNPQAPPFPQDPGPNQPVRPDFDNPGSIPPTQMQPNNDSLAGQWLYGVYSSPSDSDPLFVLPITINEGNIQTQEMTEQLNTETYGDIIITWIGNREHKTIWAAIIDSTNGDEAYVVLEKEVSLKTENMNPKTTLKVDNNFSTLLISSKEQEYYAVTGSGNPKYDQYARERAWQSYKTPRKTMQPFARKGEIPKTLGRLADKLGKVGGAIGKVAGIIGRAYTIGKGLAIADWCVHNFEKCKICANDSKCQRLLDPTGLYGKIQDVVDPPTQPSPSTGSPPVVTSFTCNGGKTCTLARGATAQLMFTYEDRDANASSWEVSGYTIGTPVGKGTISPPNGSGTINSKVRCVGSGGPKDSSNSVSVTDVTGLKSNSLSVTVKCQ
ncbi:hypothetical protein [Microcoleus anatoxicus]|uniref:Ig-like domain-containing protein n=1 Tax=Microcoleus anatoxicus PTRS2 TaxID=2705321 RepID=A0ABU8YMH0_9CYAN